MQGKQLLNFGLFHESDLTFDNSEVTSVFSVKGGELIATTLAQIVHFEKRRVLAREHLQFTTGVYVPKYNIVIAATVKACQIYIFSLRAFGRPIVSGFDTGQQAVNRIIFSSKSDTLITLSERVKTWKLKVETPLGESDVILPTISITKRAVLHGKFPIIGFSEVGFDSKHELLFLPTSEGIRPFTLDGEAHPVSSKVPANPATVYHYREETENLITEDPNLGICLWHRLGTLVKRLEFSAKPIMYFAFIDDEHVVIMDSDATLFIMNVLTGKSHVCFTAPAFPTGVHICGEGEEKRLVLVSHNLIYTYKVSVMWRVWALNVAKPQRIKRTEKPGEPARVLVEDENWAAKLFSPKNGAMLTEATPREAVKPCCYYYDRGYIENQHWDDEGQRFVQSFVKVSQKKEKVIMTLNNGEVRVFDCLTNPANEDERPPGKGSVFTLCCSEGKWMWAMFAGSGDLSLFTYQSFELVRRVSISYEQAVSMHYFQTLNLLVVQYPKEFVLVDPDRMIVMDKMPFAGTTAVEYYGELVFAGGESGVISRIDINNNVFNRKHRQVHSHKTEITGISVAPTFWISSSSDGVVVVWNHEDAKLCKIVCPWPVYACGILNGKRDILLATVSEIMIVDGVRIFGDVTDDENEQLDNFDRRPDPLDTATMLMYEHKRLDFAGEKEPSPQRRTRYRISAKLRQLIEQHRQALLTKTETRSDVKEPPQQAVPTQKGVIDPERKRKLVAEMREITDAAAEREEKSKPQESSSKTPKKSPARTPVKRERVILELPREPVVATAEPEQKTEEPPPPPQEEGNKALKFLQKSMDQERRAEERRSRRRQRAMEKEKKRVIEPPKPEPEPPQVKPRHRFNLTCPLPKPEEVTFDFTPDSTISLDPAVVRQIERRKSRSNRLATTQPLFNLKKTVLESDNENEAPNLELASGDQSHNGHETGKHLARMKIAKAPSEPDLVKSRKKRKHHKEEAPRLPTPSSIPMNHLEPAKTVEDSAPVAPSVVDHESVHNHEMTKKQKNKAKHGKKRPPALTITRTGSSDRLPGPDTVSPNNPSPLPFSSVTSSKSTTFMPSAPPVPRKQHPKEDTGKVLEVRSIGRLVESQNVSTLARDIRKMYEEEEETKENGTFLVTEPERIQAVVEESAPNKDEELEPVKEPPRFYDATDIFPRMKPKEPPPKDPTIEMLKILQRIERNLRPEEEDYAKWRGVPAKLQRMIVRDIEDDKDMSMPSTIGKTMDRPQRSPVVVESKSTHAQVYRGSARRSQKRKEPERSWRAEMAQTNRTRSRVRRVPKA